MEGRECGVCYAGSDGGVIVIGGGEGDGSGSDGGVQQMELW